MRNVVYLYCFLCLIIYQSHRSIIDLFVSVLFYTLFFICFSEKVQKNDVFFKKKAVFLEK